MKTPTQSRPPTHRRPVELEIHRIYEYDEAACLKALRLALGWAAPSKKRV